MLWKALLVLLLIWGTCATHTEAKYEFVEYCNYFKFPVEEHFVTTDDGYILRIFRIQKKRSTIVSGLKPILLQHGLLDSSDTWIINSESKSPAFMLANEGYDIWLGNSRGNKHSRAHVKYNPNKDEKFWEFTFQHMADHDLPAFFKYISNHTSQKKIDYIGHNEGSMSMNIALSKRNGVVESLLGKYFAFGPVAYIRYSHSHVIDLFDKGPMFDWYRLRGIH